MENTEKLQETQQQMSRSDLIGQQHQELASKAAEYQSNIAKYTLAINKTEQFKQQIIEKQQKHQQLILETRGKMELAKENAEPMEIFKAAEASSVLANNLLYQFGHSSKKIPSFFEGLKNSLPAEAAEFADKEISEAREQSRSKEEELLGVFEHDDLLLKSSLTQLDNSITSYSNLKAEIKQQVKEVDQLEVNVMRLKRDMAGYNNRRNNQPPPPSNNDTPNTPRP